MDVTPQVINEVEFHQKMRGYDPDEVDDFLERVAVAVAQLTERLHESEARAATADRRALELERKVRELGERPAAKEGGDETETITRTLVLAQKTADAAVKEANDEAQRTVADARQQADALMSEAQQKSQQLVSDAEADARKTSEETRQRVVDEIVELEEAREALKADHGILERHLEEQRLRLRSSIGDLQRLLDDPAKLRAASMPELSGASRPSFVQDADDDTSTTASGEGDELIDLESEAGNRGDEGGGSGDDAVERPITGGVRFSPPEDASGGLEAYGASTAVATDENEGDTDAWSRFVSEEMLDQPTEAVSMPAGEDAYLVELRKAMVDSPSRGVGERPTRTRFGRRR
jgi:DivIVA domain-containing protein